MFENLQDYKTRVDKENTVKGVNQSKHTFRKYFQINFNVSHVKLYMDRLEIDFIKY